MTEGKIPKAPFPTPTRRQVIAGGAVAFAGLALEATNSNAQETMTEAQSTGPDKARTFLHQEVELKASPHRIYDILLDSKQFAAFSGESAEISREAGGAFSMFGGKIVGRNIELVPDQRIVQAWRPTSWDPGEYTIAKFQLKQDGDKTKIILDHTGFHEGDFAHFDPGWKMRYWEPMAKYLG
jgi:activator of HSP90 ATPase